MIIKVTSAEGQSALIDNNEQENGAVKIQGDAPLVSHLHTLLNQHLTIQFREQSEIIDAGFQLFTRDGFPNEIYKASDFYMENRFIPIDCELFGYTAEVVKE